MGELNIHDVLGNQYRASIEMLLQAIDKCPESLWLAPGYPNKFWHIAYHALFYTDLYLQASEAEFHPWAQHRPNYQFLGSAPWPPFDRPKIEVPYSKAEILAYHEVCRGEIDDRVRALNLASPSGFPWLPFSRLELHVYNLRHLQHHAGQLIDRLTRFSHQLLGADFEDTENLDGGLTGMLRESKKGLWTITHDHGAVFGSPSVENKALADAIRHTSACAYLF